MGLSCSFLIVNNLLSFFFNFFFFLVLISGCFNDCKQFECFLSCCFSFLSLLCSIDSTDQREFAFSAIHISNLQKPHIYLERNKSIYLLSKKNNFSKKKKKKKKKS